MLSLFIPMCLTLVTVSNFDVSPAATPPLPPYSNSLIRQIVCFLKPTQTQIGCKTPPKSNKTMEINVQKPGFECARAHPDSDNGA